MVEQVFGAGQLRFANLTPAELAQQARQRDGVQQSERFRQVPQSERPEPGRVQQARPIPPDQGNVPAVRPADLTQQSQFTLATANAPTERPQSAEVQVPGRRSGVGAELGGRGAPTNAAGGDRRTGPSTPAVDVPDPEATTTSGNVLVPGDITDARNPGDAFGTGEDRQPGGDGERRAQVRTLTERVNALQSAGIASGQTDPSAVTDGSANDNPSAPPDTDPTGGTNGGAGPIPPSGTNLDLVA